MKKTQLLKGVLAGCVLKIISEKEIYGYELVQILQRKGFTSIVGGTIYPLLQKLEKQELIVATFKSSPEGPDRKYFKITTSGENALKEFELEWQELVTNVANLWEDN